MQKQLEIAQYSGIGSSDYSTQKLVIVESENQSSDTVEIVPLMPKDIKEAAKTLADAFKNDPLLLWIFGNAKAYESYSQKMFETYIGFSMLYGKAYRTSNFETIAILKTPYTKPLNLFSLSSLYKIIYSGIFLNVWYLGIFGILRALQCDALSKEQVKKHMGDTPAWSLWYFGTKPKHQNKKFGKQVLNFIDQEIKLSKSDSKTVCISATTLNATRLYESRGYQAYGSYVTPSGHRITCLSNKNAKKEVAPEKVSLAANCS